MTEYIEMNLAFLVAVVTSYVSEKKKRKRREKPTFEIRNLRNFRNCIAIHDVVLTWSTVNKQTSKQASKQTNKQTIEETKWGSCFVLIFGSASLQ